jgi:hypothetical protein
MHELLQRARRVLDGEDYETLEALFESYAYIAELVSQEDMTTDRLYETLYGPDHEPPVCTATDRRNPGTAMSVDDPAGIADG